MRVLILEGANWQTSDDFYDAFFDAVGAPGWHGRNLNALNDSIGAGDINRVEVPYAVRIRGVRLMGAEARQTVENFRGLVEQLRGEGVEVQIECE